MKAAEGVRQMFDGVIFDMDGLMFDTQSIYDRAYIEVGRNEYGAGKDEHSLERERINGVAMNTDAWYDLFDVIPGDKLYLKPEERTHIW